jgi:hypothetical protein
MYDTYVMKEAQQNTAEVVYEYDGEEYTTLNALSEWAVIIDGK